MNTVPNVMMINRHAIRRNPGWLAVVWQTVRIWSDRAAQRRALASLDDRALHDIGLSRSVAAGEAGKPFWRP